MAIKAMLVEDENDLLTLLKFYFEQFGYEIIEAHNGQEAIDILSKMETDPAAKPPQVIVTDVMMPVKDGYTMVTELQEMDNARRIPIIVMTAKGQVRELFQATPNIAAFIEKPFQPKALKQLIDTTVTK